VSEEACSRTNPPTQDTFHTSCFANFAVEYPSKMPWTGVHCEQVPASTKCELRMRMEQQTQKDETMSSKVIPSAANGRWMQETEGVGKFRTFCTSQHSSAPVETVPRLRKHYSLVHVLPCGLVLQRREQHAEDDVVGGTVGLLGARGIAAVR